MGKRLSPSAVAQYDRDGFYFPIRVLSATEAREFRLRLEAVEREQGGPLRGELRHKGHLVFTWLDRLVRHPVILDAVEAILGPNILCWRSSAQRSSSITAGKVAAMAAVRFFERVLTQRRQVWLVPSIGVCEWWIT